MSILHLLEKANRGEEISVNEIVAACGDHFDRNGIERRLVDAGYFYAIAYDAFMPPAWVAEHVVASGGPHPQDLSAIIMDEWGPPVSDAVRAMRPSLNDYYKDGINECPQAEEIMRKHGYWEEGMK